MMLHIINAEWLSNGFYDDVTSAAFARIPADRNNSNFVAYASSFHQGYSL